MYAARIRLATAAAVTTAAVVFTGCQNNYQTPPPRPSVNILSTNIRISLTMKPTVLRQMDPVIFTVRAVDTHGALVKDATVNADLGMPFMDMGKNTIRFRSAGPGVYSGNGRFSMDGEWNVVVTAVKGRDKTVQTFSVHVR